jgi:Tol biopolymer transport system component
MITNDRFERDMSSWLHEDATFRVPDHLAEVLEVTRVTRQRPAWSSLERWLPVDTTFRPRFLNLPQPGRLALLAGLILLLVALAIVAIGSRQPRLPEPFGLAANGVLVTSRDGELYTVDPTTSLSSPLVIGDGFDFSPIFSRDGTKIAFLRSDGPISGPAILTMMVANADGTGLHDVTPATENMEWFDWSPNGTQIVYMASGQLWVADVAGGAPRMLPGTKPAHFPTWLPPDGREIVFRLETVHPTIMAIRPDGTGLRPLSTKRAQNPFDYQGPAISPDGSLIAFTRYSRFGEPSSFLLDPRIGEERRLPAPDGTRAESGGLFSPDGKNIAFVRYYADATWQVTLAPVDGSGDGAPIGPRSSGTPQTGNAGVSSMAFTPDGSALLVRYGDDASATTHLLPIDGSQGRIIDTGEFLFVDMQRLAP